MDKAILKKFAIESRKDLMEKIKNKINTFYINEEFTKEQKGEIYVLSNEKHSLSLTNEEYQKRELLIKRIKELSLEQVIEEAAYTWFNRIIAIRYMEINDYLPLTKDNQSLGIRVLSSKDNTPDPEILKFTNLINPDLDIDFKKEKYIELKDENEKFKYVLLLVCKKLGRVIPQVFDGITDYIDILIPDNLLNDTGFITKIINEVPENNYNKVEIIGWLYQYYISEKKDMVFANTKKGKKVEKDEIPAATQLFTPDWIVKYMVENSIGKHWIECNCNLKLLENWKYIIQDNLKLKNKSINPIDIKCIDPCCGSGHILIYMFEVLYQIYESVGYNKGDIAKTILKNNIYGIDVDDRACQLSILSLILKAREYDRNIFSNEIVKQLNVISIQESANLDLLYYNLSLSEESIKLYKYLVDVFINAKEIGSLLIIEDKDYSKLLNELENDNTIFGFEVRNTIIPIIKQAKMLTQKYDVVITNPPYMNSNVMSEKLKKYLNKYYQNSKTDLCTAFMENHLVKNDGILAMINQHSWMFLGSFKELRYQIIKNNYIESMIHLGTRAFEEIGGEVVQTTTWVLRKKIKDEESIIIKLTDINNAFDKEKTFLKINQNKSDRKYYKNLKEILEIPSCPIAYWIDNKTIKIFAQNEKLSNICVSKTGMTTGDNNLFLREWFEINFNKMAINNITNKWFPYNKGGGYRKWYGNLYNVIDWENEGSKVKEFKKSTIRNEQFYFRNCITWNLITTTNISVRYLDIKSVMGDAGPACYNSDEQILKYTLGLLNSKVAHYLLNIINPTMNYSCGVMEQFPYISKLDQNIIDIVNINIELAKGDWDSFETSWDFKGHPLIKNMTGQYIRDLNGKPNFYLFSVFDDWNHKTEIRFNKLKENEEKLNEIFIDIYGLKDELTPEVEDKDITIRKADKEREIKSLISYAVGCMFGRYSLDKEGLIYAGGDFDEIYKKYKKADGGWAGASLSNYKILNDNGKEVELSFEVDNDNVIPITDEAYFGDDIVERFKNFIKVVYGKDTFNENMDFIAETLGKKGTETSEDTIRRYFLNDFFNDHVKTYQKRPIYWLFDSGKKNGFKALVYMHRYNENLIPKVRLDYLHRIQTTYEKLLSDVNYKLTTDLSMTDKKATQNRQADLNAKLNEIKEYDEKIAHIANQRISIDLDDGVKVNYEKFKDILAKIK